MTRSAVVYLTHFFHQAAARRFERMRRETAGVADCFVLLQDDGGPVRAAWEEYLQSIDAMDALKPFQAEALADDLGFPFFGKHHVMGNTHFPLLRFARAHEYPVYWQVESDVEYRGHWGDFVRAFDNVGVPVLATHLHKQEEWPTWDWWKSARVPTGMKLPVSQLRKAFFPVSRFQSRALAAIEDAHRAGWRAHFEVLIPSVMALAGTPVRDLREFVPCYVGESQNPVPILPLLSSFRWRPEVSIKEFTTRPGGKLLFHPIKQNWFYDGQVVVRFSKAPPPLAEPPAGEPAGT